MKRLFYDIETSLSLFSGFQIGYNINVSYKNLIWESRVVCICYKWQDEDEVHSLRWDNGKDKKMIKKFIKILDKADSIVAHNGDGFDLPIIRTRALKHRLKMNWNYTEEDTLKLAKRRAGKGFKFQSNRLDYVAQFLEVGQKIPTDFSLWERVSYPIIIPHLYPMSADYEKAMNDMVTYCKMDVEVLQKVYEVLKPYVPQKIHAAAMNDDHLWNCASCGSGNVKRNGNKISAAGVKKQQWICYDCEHQYYTPQKIALDYLQWRIDQKKFNDEL